MPARFSPARRCAHLWPVAFAGSLMAAAPCNGAAGGHASPPGSCRIRGDVVDVDAVEVTPPGAAAFSLYVRGTPVEAEPGRRRTGPHEVLVHGVLEFRGVARDLPFRIEGRTTAGFGMVSLSADADVVRVWQDGAKVRADVLLGWGEVELRGLVLSCDAIGLGVHGPADDPPILDGNGTVWRPDRRTVAFHAAPGSRRRLRVRFRGEVVLWGVAQRDGYVEVFYEGPDATVMRGWVRRRDLVPGAPSWHGGARDYAGVPPCGRGFVQGPNVRFGPATAAPGTPVYAAPGRGPWATVGSAEAFTALQYAGDPWTQIVAVPGLGEAFECGPLEHAWIRSDAVRFAEP